MKRPAGASCARFSKLTRRRGEGLRRNPPAEAPRIALFWPAAPGATCAPREGGRRACRCPRGAPRGLFRASCVPSAPCLSTHRKIFSKIVLASAGEFPYSTFSHGGVAQLGERLTGSQEVRGSIPLVSTRALNEAPTQVGAFFHIGTQGQRRHHDPPGRQDLALNGCRVHGSISRRGSRWLACSDGLYHIRHATRALGATVSAGDS